jgi:hypothetical protein
MCATVGAKAIVRAFYDIDPTLSYWDRCHMSGESLCAGS